MRNHRDHRHGLLAYRHAHGNLLKKHQSKGGLDFNQLIRDSAAMSRRATDYSTTATPEFAL